MNKNSPPQKNPPPSPANKRQGKAMNLPSLNLSALSVPAIILSLLAIVGLLTYGFWGEPWLRMIGKEDGVTPHAHGEISTIQQQADSQTADMAELQNRLQQLGQELQATRTATERRFNQVTDDNLAGLQELRDDYASLQDIVRDDPELLTHIVTLIHLRQAQGEALGDIPELLRNYAADNPTLQNFADVLQQFTEVRIPSDYDLVTGYEAVRPHSVIGFGGGGNFTTERNIFENLKKYIASLVTVRKLTDVRQTASPTNNLTAAVHARDFKRAEDLTKELYGISDDLDGWLAGLRLRNQADAAILGLQEYLHGTIGGRLQGGDS